MPHIGDHREKKENNSRWYLLAVFVGISVFVIFLGLAKILVFLIKFVVEHWIIAGVITLVLLFLIKKYKKSKRKKEAKKYEYRY